MNAILAQVRLCPNADPVVDDGACHASRRKPILQMLAVASGVLATAVSLGVATYAGWHRGGLPIERAMNIALGGVAVLLVHLLPVWWGTFGRLSRAGAFGLWCVGLVVVLYGQVAFIMLSQQHAGVQRASAVPVVPQFVPTMPPGRALTSIAQDIARVETELARREARRCDGDCAALRARRTILMARLAALNAEVGDAKRREAEEDRRNEQIGRNEALRATLRADPVASTVAYWLGTTDARLELVLGVACAVVLEGAAIIGWLLVSRTSGRAGSRETVASERETVAGLSDTATAPRSAQALDDATVAPERAATGEVSAGAPHACEDDLLLERIHKAVMAGQLKPTQTAIRRFLRCGQPKAGHLNRQYLARYGGERSNVEDIMDAPHGRASLHVSPKVVNVKRDADFQRVGSMLPAVANAKREV